MKFIISTNRMELERGSNIQAPAFLTNHRHLDEGDLVKETITDFMGSEMEVFTKDFKDFEEFTKFCKKFPSCRIDWIEEQFRNYPKLIVEDIFN